jgi:tRNA nucleotidyltransferase/poly(A) polymerase
MKIPDNIQQMLCRFVDYKMEVYVVGGAVRDHLLGLDPTDFDLCTSATPEQLQEIFFDREVKLVGESFGVTLVDGVEIATFRVDRHSGVGDKNCTVEYAYDIIDDLKRRDFTINAIAYNPFSKTFTDPHDGMYDICKRILRFVGNPHDRITEDPNRMLRAARFAARLEFNIHPETLTAMSHWSRYVKHHVKPERIQLEVMKAMESPNASDFFGVLLTTNILQYVFPSLHDTFHKGTHHGKHHVESIWEHSMIAGDSVSTKNPLVKLAGYLHDVGKVRYVDEENFGGHEKTGQSLVMIDLLALKFSHDEIAVVSGLVRCHMYSLFEASPKAVRRIVKQLNDHNVQKSDFLRLKIADRKGNVKRGNHTLSEMKHYHSVLHSVEIKETPFTVKELKVNGNDIMRAFNLLPGKTIGTILNHLLEYVIEEGPEHNTYDLLLTEARVYYSILREEQRRMLDRTLT